MNAIETLPVNDFNLYIERIKLEKGFDGYLDAITWYVENETNVDYDKIVRNLNQKIIDCIRLEAMKANLLKEKEEWVLL